MVLPLQMKLATVIKNGRTSESVSATKGINHEFDEEHSKNNNSTTSNNSTFQTSTSISVSPHSTSENEVYIIWRIFMCLGILFYIE